MKNIKIGIALLGAVGLLSIGIPALTMARSNNGDMHGFMGFHLGQAAITGTVASISGNTITLTGSNSTTYTVDATNAQILKFANNTKTTITVSGIATGDTLTVFGTTSGTTVSATKIVDGTVPPKSEKSEKLKTTTKGTVASISGNTITLTGSNSTTYTVDASNAQLMIVKPAGTSIANSGIQVGDTLSVMGTITGTNIVATKIMDGAKNIHLGD